MKTKILLLLNLLLISTLSFGFTRTVTNANASGEGSFAQAFADAVTGDTINFNFDGTEITFSGEFTMEKSITFHGLNAYNDQKVIFKQAAGSRFFKLNTGFTGTFKNLIFDGTDILGNSGIDALKGSTLNIDSCEFKNINAPANNGGAVRIQGTANIVNSVFDGNQASGSYGGGAIAIYNNAEVVIDKCTFVNNSSLKTGSPNGSGGGAIVIRGTVATPTKLTVSNSTFANNNSSNFGSAILCSVQSSKTNCIVNVDIINCTITGNATAVASGAVEMYANFLGTLNLNLINSIVTHNVNSSGYSDVLETTESTTTATYTTELYNTIYGVSSVTPDAGRNCIAVADPAVANIFRSLETFATDKKRPELTSVSGQKIAAISETSIANAAGIATLAGFTIPTEDQIGGDRPATPSIGAVEYYPSVGVSDAVNTELKMITKDKVISFTGLSEVSPVAVYGLTGNLLHQSLVGNNQEISLNHLSDNLVIVRINNKSFKAFLK